MEKSGAENVPILLRFFCPTTPFMDTNRRKPHMHRRCSRLHARRSAGDFFVRLPPDRLRIARVAIADLLPMVHGRCGL